MGFFSGEKCPFYISETGTIRTGKIRLAFTYQRGVVYIISSQSFLFSCKTSYLYYVKKLIRSIRYRYIHIIRYIKDRLARRKEDYTWFI